MDQINQIPITAENVEKIVDEFYATSQVTNEFKPQLDQWLKNAQNSPEAWVFSWTLIDMSKSINCQFYAASCLYTKVSKYFEDVPDDQYDLLKNKLLEKLLLYASTIAINQKQPQIRLIQRKLNSTLAKLALYLIPDQWQNCVLDIIQTIPNCVTSRESTSAATAAAGAADEYEQKNQLVLIVIDLLTLLAEEFPTLGNLSKLNRIQIKSQLKKNFRLIAEYILNLFNCFNGLTSTPPPDSSCFKIVEGSIKCLTSWIQFNTQHGEIDLDEIKPFFEYLFVYIYNDSFFEQSAQCLTDFFYSEGTHKYANTLFKYMPHVLALKNLLNKYVQQKDNDGCVVLTKLILSYAECELYIIFDGLLHGDDSSKTIILEFIQLIISLSSIPGNFPVDEESSDLTFVFWYTLQDSILGIDQNSEELRLIFRPFFITLMEIFISKLQLPESYEDWSPEDKERLRCYRIDIGDTMVYMISMIGELMLEFIMKRLVSAIENQNTDWKLQEALIYMLQSVVSELNESCSPDFNNTNDPCLTSFIDILPKINYSNKHILSTTLLAVGSLGSWLERNVHMLPNAISLCLLGLKTESVTQSASFAIKDIINDCNLAPYANQIISSCQECLRTANLAQNYEARLMSIIGMSISDLLTIDQERTLAWLNEILEPQMNKLSELAQTTIIDKQTQSLTCHTLNLLSQFMSSLVQRQQGSLTQTAQPTPQPPAHSASVISPKITEKEIVNSILVKLMPIYKQFVMRNAPSDSVIIDKLFESISVILTSNLATAAASDLVVETATAECVLNNLVEMFYCLNENAWRRFAYEVCRQIFLIWWNIDKYKPLIENLFMLSFQNAMKLMSKDMDYFHDHTDVVEQYCVCLAKLLKQKYYDLFEKLNNESIGYLIKFIQFGMQLPEQYTLRSVAMFIEEFVKYTKVKNKFELMEHHAVGLVHVALVNISGGLPRHLVDILATVLHVMVKEYPQLTNTVLNQILVKTDFQPYSLTPKPQQNLPQSPGQQQSTLPTTVLSKEQKAAFIRSMLNEANNKRKFKEIVTEFSLTCRGLINSQYAKETSKKY